MSLRLIAATLAFTTLTACAVPRTAIVAGAATAIAGGIMLSDAHSLSHREEHNIPGAVIDGVASYTEALAGTMVLLVGAGVITSGAIGLGMESRPALAPLGPLAQAPAAFQTTAEPVTIESAAESAAFAPPASATAVLAARREQLTAQIWIEIRAGHCGTATAAARRLAVLDRDRVIALIDRNPAVASCLAYRM